MCRVHAEMSSGLHHLSKKQNMMQDSYSLWSWKVDFISTQYRATDIGQFLPFHSIRRDGEFRQHLVFIRSHNWSHTQSRPMCCSMLQQSCCPIFMNVHALCLLLKSQAPFPLPECSYRSRMRDSMVCRASATFPACAAPASVNQTN
jgi:hypothetical protein